MVILNYLLPAFFIIFSFSELVRVQFPNAVAFNLIDICVLLLIGVWLFFVKKSKRYELKIPILIFIIVCFISLLINIKNFEFNQIIVGAMYLFRWILYSMLYFVFKDIGNGYDNKIIKYMTISGLIVIVLGLIQFTFFSSLSKFYTSGWDNHLYRMFSTFLDPNFVGTFLVLFLVFIFIIRDKFIENKKAYNILNISVILAFISIILTYSRGAILMLIVSALVYCILKKNYKIILSLIGVLIIIVIILSPRFYLVNNDLFRIPSLAQRIDNSKEALVVFTKNPIAGVGFNNFRYAREKYGFKDLTEFGYSHAGAGSDNSLILVLATTGIVGFTAYLFLLFKTFKLGFSKINKNPFALILVISLSGLLVNSLLLNSLFYSFILIWMFILAGLTESS